MCGLQFIRFISHLGKLCGITETTDDKSEAYDILTGGAT